MSLSTLRRIGLPRISVSRSQLRTLADLLFASLIFSAVFAVHARWIYTHFSNDAYLLDSGWLAYLFESADPLLRNPSGINELSFYAHHLQPHIFLFGAPLSYLCGLTGIEIFAYHQGLFFGLFFISLYLIVASAHLRFGHRMIGTLVAILVGTLANALFQAAAYPHVEIAMIAVSSLAVAAWFGEYRRLFAFCLLWLPLIREDGGLYVTFTCLVCIAVEFMPNPRLDSRTLRLLILALAGIIVSACSLSLKAWFFPGFDTFSSNFSGHSWDHVSVGFLADRLKAAIGSLNIAPVLVGCLLLSVFDVRYMTGLVLLSPLYLLHLLSVRSEHGHFTLYYALPWLLPCTVWLVVFVRRSRSSALSTAESVLLLVLSLSITAPIHAAVGTNGQSWHVAKWALTGPVADIQGMKNFALWARASFAGATDDRVGQEKDCVSMGIAALIPNDIHPDEVLNVNDDVAACRTLLLMRGEMQYELLSERAQAAKFARVAARENVELWWIGTRPGRTR
jgi:hypothetical protein